MILKILSGVRFDNLKLNRGAYKLYYISSQIQLTEKIEFKLFLYVKQAWNYHEKCCNVCILTS